MGVNKTLHKGKKNQQAGNSIRNWEGEEVLPAPTGVTKATKPHPFWGWRHAKTRGLQCW